MKQNKLLASLLLLSMAISLTTENGFAKAASETKQKGNNSMKSQLGTSFRFDGTSLYGKFQKSPSTTAMVEDDKFIDDLLGARKSFNDRINKDRERN